MAVSQNLAVNPDCEIMENYVGTMTKPWQPRNARNGKQGVRLLLICTIISLIGKYLQIGMLWEHTGFCLVRILIARLH
ncbi:MAG: hypothetical protein EAX81_02540 [Candidatus Thorarchaeota archaeon]|nr:hypothetical protein [Candidatus Thorarchaeota archaeon]